MTYVRIANTRLYHIATDRRSRTFGTVHVRCKDEEVSADDVRYTKPDDGDLCARCFNAGGVSNAHRNR